MDILNNRNVISYLKHAAAGKTTDIAHNLYRLRTNSNYGTQYDVSDIINHQIRLSGLVDIVKVNIILHNNIKANIRQYNFKRAQHEFHVINLLNQFSLKQKHQGFCFLKSGQLFIYVLGANILSDLDNGHNRDAEWETKQAELLAIKRTTTIKKFNLEMHPITQSSMQKLAKNIYNTLHHYFQEHPDRENNGILPL